MIYKPKLRGNLTGHLVEDEPFIFHDGDDVVFKSDNHSYMNLSVFDMFLSEEDIAVMETKLKKKRTGSLVFCLSNEVVRVKFRNRRVFRAVVYNTPWLKMVDNKLTLLNIKGAKYSDIVTYLTSRRLRLTPDKKLIHSFKSMSEAYLRYMVKLSNHEESILIEGSTELRELKIIGRELYFKGRIPSLKTLINIRKK